MYEAKNSKICNFCTFWPLVQLINHLFKIRKKAICPTIHRWHINRVIDQDIQELLFFAVFASYIASILKCGDLWNLVHLKGIILWNKCRSTFLLMDNTLSRGKQGLKCVCYLHSMSLPCLQGSKMCSQVPIIVIVICRTSKRQSIYVLSAH